MRYTIYFIMMILLTTFMPGCQRPSQDQDEKDKTVRIVYTEWSEAVALTHLSEILLEDKLEYEVQTKLTEVESAYKEVAEGKAHVFTDAWLPRTHSRYYEKFGQSVVKLGVIYPGARTGLLVPDYSEYESIEDLKGEKIQILGIDTGAGVMQQTRRAIERYGLEHADLLSLSEEKMTARFEEHYRRRKEVIVTGWEPHWIFDRYEVRFLTDPYKQYGQQENIFALGAKNLEKEHPRLVRYFERMQLSERQINSLINYMKREDDPEKGIREWIRKNEYIVNQWVKNLKPDRKKIM